MAEMDFGRQLQPVQVLIRGGEQIDRLEWRRIIHSYLMHKSCMATLDHDERTEIINIYPDANND